MPQLWICKPSGQQGLIPLFVIVGVGVVGAGVDVVIVVVVVVGVLVHNHQQQQQQTTPGTFGGTAHDPTINPNDIKCVSV